VGQDGTLRRVGNPSPDWLMGLADCQLLQDVILPNKLRNSISLVARTRGCRGPFIAAPQLANQLELQIQPGRQPLPIPGANSPSVRQPG
jgi:hypothetical protein